MSSTRSDDGSLPYKEQPINLQSAGTLRGHAWETSVLRFSPDSTTLAAGSDQAPLILWNLHSRSQHATLDAHIATPSQLAFSPTEPLVAMPDSTGLSAQICTYDGILLTRLSDHPSGLQGIAFLPSGNLLLTVDGQGTVRIWEWANQRTFSSFSTLTDGANKPSIYAQGVHTNIQFRAKEDTFVYGIALNTTGSELIINGYHPDGLLHRWLLDPATGRARFIDRHISPDQRDFIRDQRFSRDGRFLAILVTTYYEAGKGPGLHERVELYHTDPFRLAAVLRLPLGDRWGAVNSLAFSPDTRYLLMAAVEGYETDEEGMLWIWDISRRRYLPPLHVHPDPGDNQVWSIKAADWSGMGTLIATAGWEPSERGHMSVIEHLADQLVVKLWQVEEQNR